MALSSEIVNLLFDGGYLAPSNMAPLRETDTSCRDALACRRSALACDELCATPAGIDYAFAHPTCPLDDHRFFVMVVAHGTVSQMMGAYRNVHGGRWSHSSHCVRSSDDTYAHILVLAARSHVDPLAKLRVLSSWKFVFRDDTVVSEVLAAAISTGDETFLRECAACFSPIPKFGGILSCDDYQRDSRIPRVVTALADVEDDAVLLTMMRFIKSLFASEEVLFSQLRFSLLAKGDARFAKIFARRPCSSCELMHATRSGCRTTFDTIFATYGGEMTFRCILRYVKSSLAHDVAFTGYVARKCISLIPRGNAISGDDYADACVAAATAGNLEALVAFADIFGRKWVPHVTVVAACEGHVKIIEYADRHGLCDPNSDALEKTRPGAHVLSGKPWFLHVLYRLGRAKNDPVDLMLCALVAVMRGQRSVVEYFLTNHSDAFTEYFRPRALTHMSDVIVNAYHDDGFVEWFVNRISLHLDKNLSKNMCEHWIYLAVTHVKTRAAIFLLELFRKLFFTRKKRLRFETDFTPDTKKGFRQACKRHKDFESMHMDVVDIQREIDKRHQITAVFKNTLDPRFMRHSEEWERYLKYASCKRVVGVF